MTKVFSIFLKILKVEAKCEIISSGKVSLRRVTGQVCSTEKWVQKYTRFVLHVNVGQDVMPHRLAKFNPPITTVSFGVLKPLLSNQLAVKTTHYRLITSHMVADETFHFNP